VHCIAGVSRSVSIVLAYLIRDKGMTYDEAYQSVKVRRQIVTT
jgi:protein-tyrosine phosphatase